MSATTAAVILCGGHSQRMGQPKAWLPFGGELLLQRVVRLLGSVANPLVVVAAVGQELPSLPSSVLVAHDTVPDRGPLQGLAAGLKALPESVEFCFATATDVPFLAPALVDRLRSFIGEADLAIPHVLGRHHPLAALYRRSPALLAIETLLGEDQRRLTLLTERLITRNVGVDELRQVDPELRSLCNLNTPEDYLTALQVAGFDPPRLRSPSPCE